MDELEAIVQSFSRNGERGAKLDFQYDPVGEGGVPGHSWQGLLTTPSFVICDYGRSLDEAASKVLDRFKNPHLYGEEED